MFYEVLSIENYPWASLGCSLGNRRKELMSTKAYFREKAFAGKPAYITFGENKDVNSGIKFRLYNNFAPVLGGAFAMGTNTMALVQAFSVQAHHDCSTKAVFL